MSAEGKFLVYCLETYKAAKRMIGRQVIEMFIRYGITDYLLSSYEALHTTGTNYIIEDIDLFVEAQQATKVE
jgi:hypothetical protein